MVLFQANPKCESMQYGLGGAWVGSHIFLHLTRLCMNTDAWHRHWCAQDLCGVLQHRVTVVMSTVALIKLLRYKSLTDSPVPVVFLVVKFCHFATNCFWKNLTKVAIFQGRKFLSHI